MNYKWIIIIFAAIALLIFLVMLRDARRRKINFIQELRESWGNPSGKEWSADHLDYLKEWEEQEKVPFRIDDITWNDLEMNKLYTSIDHTYSSCGEEYLYKILRRPSFSAEEIKGRQEKYAYAATHEKERMAILRTLSMVGRRNGIVYSDTIRPLMETSGKSTIPYFVLCFLNIASIVLLFFHPVAAVLMILAVMIINGSVHAREYQVIQESMISFSYLLRMIRCGEKICAIGDKDSAFREEFDEVREITGKLVRIRKKCVTLAGISGTDASVSAVFSYFHYFFLLDFIQFYNCLKLVKAAEKDILRLQEVLGCIDFCISAASFREMLPYCCEPEFAERGTEISLAEAYHPLLQDAVANSLASEKQVLLTGSNASGKSTFLKTVALNQILAQSLGIAAASKCKVPFLRVMTSMSLKDSFEKGESYYVAEIKAIQRIFCAAEDKTTDILCVLDEVLRGTNTVERIAAASAILSDLAKRGAYVFAATHDRELTGILRNIYENYHFRECVEQSELVFDYVLHKGVSTGRNALKLLASFGYDPALLLQAENEAAHFEKEGNWTPVC